MSVSTSAVTAAASAAPAATPAAATTQSADTLSSSDFMQLFVTQLANQDPTQPMDSSTMMTEVAQMNSVETMSNLGTTMTNLTNNINTLSTVAQSNQAQGLLQHQVNYVDQNGSPQTATVQSLLVGADGTVKLNLSNSSAIALSSVTQIF